MNKKVYLFGLISALIIIIINYLFFSILDILILESMFLFIIPFSISLGLLSAFILLISLRKNDLILKSSEKNMITVYMSLVIFIGSYYLIYKSAGIYQETLNFSFKGVPLSQYGIRFIDFFKTFVETGEIGITTRGTRGNPILTFHNLGYNYFSVLVSFIGLNLGIRVTLNNEINNVSDKEMDAEKLEKMLSVYEKILNGSTTASKEKELAEYNFINTEGIDETSQNIQNADINLDNNAETGIYNDVNKLFFAKDNYEFIAQNVATIYYYIDNSNVLEILNEDHLLTVVAFFDLYLYIKKGQLTITDIIKAKQHSKIGVITLREEFLKHENEDSEKSRYVRLVNLTMQIEAIIFGIDSEVDVNDIIQIIIEKKETIKSTIDTVIFEGEKSLLYPSISTNINNMINESDVIQYLEKIAEAMTDF